MWVQMIAYSNEDKELLMEWGWIGGEKKKKVEEVEEGKQSWTDLNLVNCQREGLPLQIPGENRGPIYLLAFQPAANHLYVIVRHKLYEDQLGICLESLLRCWIGVPASRESMGGFSRQVTCSWEDVALSSLFWLIHTETLYIRVKGKRAGAENYVFLSIHAFLDKKTQKVQCTRKMSHRTRPWPAFKHLIGLHFF